MSDRCLASRPLWAKIPPDVHPPAVHSSFPSSISRAFMMSDRCLASRPLWAKIPPDVHPPAVHSSFPSSISRTFMMSDRCLASRPLWAKILPDIMQPDDQTDSALCRWLNFICSCVNLWGVQTIVLWKAVIFYLILAKYERLQNLFQHMYVPVMCVLICHRFWVDLVMVVKAGTFVFAWSLPYYHSICIARIQSTLIASGF